MIDPNATWRTSRLIAEPITPHHAEAMQSVLSEPALYEFTGGRPLSVEELTERYERLARRRSPNGNEIWCNWALRLEASGMLVGALQVTLPSGGPGADVAHIAWEVGLSFQRRGYASEAATALVSSLLEDDWCVVAEIHPRHVASQRVAERAGLVPTTRVVDGEVQWWRDPWNGREITDDIWTPWQPVDVATRLAQVDVRWCVAAGWALDLFQGHQTRPHEDLEIAVPAGGFDQVRAALDEFEFEVVGAGHRWPIDSPALDVMTQTWMSDRATGVFLLDIFREPHDGDTWICRRDLRIRRPYADIINTTVDAIPYLAPEVALLFKAKHSRDKDEVDFRRVLPQLSEPRRAWLAEALARVHPDHRWLPDVVTDRGGAG